MLAPWVIEEMKTVELNDRRLNARLVQVLDALAGQPNLSIPAACGGAAETMAAYRLFDNGAVTFDNILEPHICKTRERVAAQPVALVVQDTTEVDVTRPEDQVVGAGPLDSDARRGALLHLLEVFVPNGTPLGALGASIFVRSDEAETNASKTRGERRAIPIEQKESFRWLQGLNCVQNEAQRQPQVQFVCIADSEGDIYEYLAQAVAGPANAHWIVRSCQDRALQRNAGENAGLAHLREQLSATPVLYLDTINVRGRTAKVACDTRGRRQARESRKAEVEVRATRLTLRPPYRPDRKLPAVTLNAVMVREIDPPAGEEAVEWILFGDLPIDTLEQVRTFVNYYKVRWMIEIVFRTLKSGCRVEDRRFEHMDRIERCLAVYLIVTWRTLYACMLGRSCPEISCEVVFERSEWKSVYRVVLGKVPRSTPPLQDMVRTVAQLGGYVNRKRNDPPGPQTVCLGLQRLHDINLCWLTFGPGARENGAKLV
jgi:Transposase DNA-binding/Transposase Tn5 dimerisation domain